MLHVMDADELSKRRRSEIGDRVDRGDFDAALRPASNEEALRDGPVQFFKLGAEVARAQFDPAEQWPKFVQALWEQVDAGFGLTVDDEDDAAIPRAWFDHPDDPAVPTAWFDHPDDPAVVAWDRRPQD